MIRRAVSRLHGRAESWLMGSIYAVPQPYLPRFKEILLAAGAQEIMLDLGGGDGRMTAPLSELAELVIVMDIAEGPGRDLVGDGHRIPLGTESVDYITCIEVLEHAAYPDRFLAEARRVMRLGGLLQLTTRQYWRTHGSPNDFFRYTEQGLRKLLDDSGFTIEGCWPMGGPFTVMAAAWDQFCGQNGLARPMLKQLFVYPVWFLATAIDNVYMRSGRFRKEPDTTGWCISARAV